MSHFEFFVTLADETTIRFNYFAKGPVVLPLSPETSCVRAPESLQTLGPVRGVEISQDGASPFRVYATHIYLLGEAVFDHIVANRSGLDPDPTPAPEPMVRARSFDLPSHRVALAPDDNFVGLDPGVGVGRPALIYTSRSPEVVDDFTPGRQIYELTPIGDALSPEAQTIETARIPALGGVAVLSRLQ